MENNKFLSIFMIIILSFTSFMQPLVAFGNESESLSDLDSHELILDGEEIILEDEQSLETEQVEQDVIAEDEIVPIEQERESVKNKGDPEQGKKETHVLKDQSEERADQVVEKEADTVKKENIKEKDEKVKFKRSSTTEIKPEVKEVVAWTNVDGKKTVVSNKNPIERSQFYNLDIHLKNVKSASGSFVSGDKLVIDNVYVPYSQSDRVDLMNQKFVVGGVDMGTWNYYRGKNSIEITLNEKAEKYSEIKDARVTISSFSAHTLNCNTTLDVTAGNAKTEVVYKNEVAKAIGTSTEMKMVGVNGTDSIRVNAGTGAYLLHYLGSNTTGGVKPPKEKGDTLIDLKIPKGYTFDKVVFESEILFPDSTSDDKNYEMTYAFMRGVDFTKAFNEVTPKKGQSLSAFKKSLKPLEYGVWEGKNLVANFGVNGDNGLKFGDERSNYPNMKPSEIVDGLSCVDDVVKKKIDAVYGSDNALKGNVPNLILKASFKKPVNKSEKVTVGAIKEVNNELVSEREVTAIASPSSADGNATLSKGNIKLVKVDENKRVIKDKKFVFEVKDSKGEQIKFSKKDVNDYVYNKKGEFSEIVVDSKGETTLFDLPLGDYQVKEIKGDIDYELDTKAHKAKIEGGKTVSVEVINKKKTPKTPEVIKDVEGKEHLEVAHEKEYNYNVKTNIPTELGGYDNLTISDVLDERLDVLGAKVLVNGEETDFEAVVKDQTVSVKLDRKQLETIKGGEINLQITAKIQSGTDIELIDNKATIQLNDNPEVDSNVVTVIPPKPITPEVVKDVEEQEHLEVAHEKEYNYNVKTNIPTELGGYDNLTISDVLDERLDVVGVKVLVEGEESDFEAIVEGQSVVLELDREQLNEIAGKEVNLQITAKIQSGTDIELIDNKATIQLNDDPAEESNVVTVIPPKPITPEIVKDVEGKEHLDIEREKNYVYNVKTNIPTELGGYKTMTITDALDRRLEVVNAKVLVDGQDSGLKANIKGQNVVLELDREQLNEIAGKEVNLQITSLIKGDVTDIDIPNTATLQLNDDPAVDSNEVTVSPIIPKDPVTPTKEEPKKTVLGKVLPSTATEIFNFLLIGAGLMVLGSLGYFFFRKKQKEE